MSKAARLRKALLILLEEHRRDGALPTSARFLFYELVARGIISKEKSGARRPDQDMNDALTDLRESAQIPWDWIVDESRSLADYSGYSTIVEGALAKLPYIKLESATLHCSQSSQEANIMIWIALILSLFGDVCAVICLVAFAVWLAMTVTSGVLCCISKMLLTTAIAGLTIPTANAGWTDLVPAMIGSAIVTATACCMHGKPTRGVTISARELFRC